MHDPYTRKTFNEYIIVDQSDQFSGASKRWDHYHDFYELYFYLGKEMSYFIDTKTYAIYKNDIVLIEPFLLHKTVYHPTSERNRILVLFHPQILTVMDGIENEGLAHQIKNLFAKRRKFSFKSDHSKELFYNAMQQLLQASLTTHSSFKNIRLRCALTELFITFLDLSYDEDVEESNPALSPKEKLVHNVITYINENYTSDITLEMICKELYISKYYLCHTFKETTGVTVISFIHTKRLSEAERLLRYSTLNITEISHAVGFNSISHFINLFKKAYKCTPTVFRKKLETEIINP
ncbi:MAG: helix-turn-helix transcriptional regulator [Epulopiscium sp.]|nr:helix-turn-helix transcriptional regulator [Candidatus Epulonipiscium sp.]